MKGKLIIVLMLCSLVLASCGAFGGKGDQSKLVNYRQGVSGVELKLLQNMPPKEILEKGPFRIGVQVNNKGAYDVSIGELTVVGINEAWNQLAITGIEMPTLRGRSLTAPEGDFYVAEFSGKNIAMPPGLEQYPVKFWVVVKYNYESIAQLDVCINPEVIVGIGKSVDCKVKDSASLSGQGAPVAVTKVEERVIPGNEQMSVEFTFYVENKGKGEVVTPIRVGDVNLANRRMSCAPDVIEARDLEEKRNKVNCIISEPLKSPYTTTLSVALDYTYEIKEKGEFTVRRLQQVR